MVQNSQVTKWQPTVMMMVCIVYMLCVVYIVCIELLMCHLIVNIIKLRDNQVLLSQLEGPAVFCSHACSIPAIPRE